MGGFAKQFKKLNKIDIPNLDVHDFRAYSESLNFVTLGIPAFMAIMSFNILSASVYSMPISISKNVVIAAVVVGAFQVTTDGFLTN